MKTRKTRDINHTGIGGKIRVPIDAEHPERLAAEILAKREYGRNGVATVPRLDNWAPDGSSHTWEAFIGLSAKGGGMTGRNVWIYT